MLVAPTWAATIFDNGLVNVIDDASHFDVIVRNSPSGDPTTLNFLANGVIGHNLQAERHSIINILGGRIGHDLLLQNNTTTFIENGHVGNNLAVGNTESGFESTHINCWEKTR